MRCNCSFTDDGVLYRRFQCFGFNSDNVTFRGGLRGLADVNSSVLAEYVLAWVASEDNVTLQGVQFKFEHSDMDEEVVIEDRCGSECATTAKPDSPTASLSISETVAVAIGAVVLVLSGVVTVLVIIIIAVKKKTQEPKHVTRVRSNSNSIGMTNMCAIKNMNTQEQQQGQEEGKKKLYCTRKYILTIKTVSSNATSIINVKSTHTVCMRFRQPCCGTTTAYNTFFSTLLSLELLG